MVLKQMGASFWVWEVHHNQQRSKIKSEPQVTGTQIQLVSRGDFSEKHWRSCT